MDERRLQAWLSPPLTKLHLEITSRCSARCVMCPQPTLERRNRDMSLAFVRDLSAQARALGAVEVHPHFFGEPTLHPDFVGVVRAIREGHPTAHLKGYTNCSRLIDPGIRKTYLTEFDEVVLSLDGPDEETLRSIRPGLKVRDVFRGVELLLDEMARHPNGPKIYARMTRMAQNDGSEEAFRRRFSGRCDDVWIVYLQNYRGFVQVAVPTRGEGPCPRPFSSLMIDVNGRAVLCCDDYDGEYPIGDANRQSLAEIWNGRPIREVRSLHLKGQGKSIDICRKCTFLGVLNLSETPGLPRAG